MHLLGAFPPQCALSSERERFSRPHLPLTSAIPFVPSSFPVLSFFEDFRIRLLVLTPGPVITMGPFNILLDELSSFSGSTHSMSAHGWSCPVSCHPQSSVFTIPAPPVSSVCPFVPLAAVSTLKWLACVCIHRTDLLLSVDTVTRPPPPLQLLSQFLPHSPLWVLCGESGPSSIDTVSRLGPGCRGPSCQPPLLLPSYRHREVCPPELGFRSCV